MVCPPIYKTLPTTAPHQKSQEENDEPIAGGRHGQEIQRAKATGMSETPCIYALGHSTRSFAELVGLLRHHDVLTLADIRTIPRSRPNPQSHHAPLAAALRNEGIRYVHLPRLGGRRRGLGKISPNAAWRN